MTDVFHEKYKANLAEQISDLLECAYSEGYSAGFEQAKKDYGVDKTGVAHWERATKEQIESWGPELVGWCDCGKPIEGRWVGHANFCPWCGKTIVWGNETENSPCSKEQGE